MIEWADKITDALPPDRLDIALSTEGSPDTRQIVVTARGRRAEELLASL